MGRKQDEIDDLQREIKGYVADDEDFDVERFMDEWDGIGVYDSGYIEFIGDNTTLYDSSIEDDETIMDAIRRVVDEDIKGDILEWWESEKDDIIEEAKRIAFNSSIENLPMIERLIETIKHETALDLENNRIDTYKDALDWLNIEVDAVVPSDEDEIKALYDSSDKLRNFRAAFDSIPLIDRPAKNIFQWRYRFSCTWQTVRSEAIRAYLHQQTIAWLNQHDEVDYLFQEELDSVIDHLIEADPDDAQATIVRCKAAPTPVVHGEPREWTIPYSDVRDFAYNNINETLRFGHLVEALRSYPVCKAWGLITDNPEIPVE